MSASAEMRSTCRASKISPYSRSTTLRPSVAVTPSTMVKRPRICTQSFLPEALQIGVPDGVDPSAPLISGRRSYSGGVVGVQSRRVGPVEGRASRLPLRVGHRTGSRERVGSCRVLKHRVDVVTVTPGQGLPRELPHLWRLTVAHLGPQREKLRGPRISRQTRVMSIRRLAIRGVMPMTNEAPASIV